MSLSDHIAALPNVEEGAYLVAAEYGGLNHILKEGALWQPGKMLCGIKTKLTCPPEPWFQTCSRCLRLKDGPNVP